MEGRKAKMPESPAREATEPMEGFFSPVQAGRRREPAEKTAPPLISCGPGRLGKTLF